MTDEELKKLEEWFNSDKMTGISNSLFEKLFNEYKKQNQEIKELKLKIMDALRIIDDDLNHSNLFNCADLILIEQILEDDENDRL